MLVGGLDFIDIASDNFREVEKFSMDVETA
jgi:hypothetical protein